MMGGWENQRLVEGVGPGSIATGSENWGLDSNCIMQIEDGDGEYSIDTVLIIRMNTLLQGANELERR